MKNVERPLRTIIRQLGGLGAPWCVVGGIAVSSRTIARFTADVDLALAVASDAEAEGIVFGLSKLGYRPIALVEQEAVGRLSTARMLEPSATEDQVVVDLIFASSGIEPEVVADAEPLEILVGLRAPVPQVGHLIAMKLLSESDRRMKDRVDLQALFEVCTPEQLARAANAVELIGRRGFDRGKDLPALLRQWTQQERPDLLEHLP
ncbi:MAG: nucleotidyl transferase AbiEii/AbiGii toxin family protein [Myxococcales bacterium]|nr:nucleotidyl transferase AbiEii/AbiGii toxin family protein [Myxococcales bacterium]